MQMLMKTSVYFNLIFCALNRKSSDQKMYVLTSSLKLQINKTKQQMLKIQYGHA